MALSNTWRAAAMMAVLLAGSCAAPTTEDGRELVADPDVNHPIVVDRAPDSVELPFTAADAGLMPEDAARFDAFVDRYKANGGGTISITAPSGPTSQQTLTYFGERLAAAGVPRSRIMVGTRDDGDARVELRFTGYVAHIQGCGKTDADPSDTFYNQPTPDFGCAVQHNLTAQIANPGDLAEPRALGPSDAMRRATVMSNYEKGQPTAATKTADQSVAVSDVGH